MADAKASALTVECSSEMLADVHRSVDAANASDATFLLDYV